MKLTPRTLLSWMDDMLSPTDTQDISRQMADSPAARDLEARIRKVVRQRRITVPEESGVDGVDSNLVASYLDNELSTEELIEFEKKTLGSDTRLAEVAGVHQILSLIGQKAKVPVDARYRMQRLLNHSPSAQSRQRRSRKQVGDSTDGFGSLSLRATPLPDPPADKPGVKAKRGFAVLVLAATALIAAVFSLRPLDVPAKKPDLVAQNQGEIGSSAPVVPQAAPKTDPVTSKSLEQETKTAPDPKTVEAKKADESAKTTTPKSVKSSELVVPEIKVVQRNGVIFRYYEGAWRSVKPDKDRFESGERLATPTSTLFDLKVGDAEVQVFGPAEWSASPNSQGGARLNLTEGRWILKDSESSKPYQITCSGVTFELTPSPKTKVSVELAIEPKPTVQPGQALVLTVATIQDGALLKIDGKLLPPLKAGTHLVNLAQASASKIVDIVPEWLEQPKLGNVHISVCEEWKKIFVNEDSVAKTIISKLGDENLSDPIKSHLIEALGQLGYANEVVNYLTDNHPETRLAAYKSLRRLVFRDPKTKSEVRDQFASFSNDHADKMLDLLIGYTPQEVTARPDLIKILVADLESSEKAVRILAIKALTDLLGRNELGYDPDEDDPAKLAVGAKPWKTLAQRKVSELLNP